MLKPTKIKCLPAVMLLFILAAACLSGLSGCSQGDAAERSNRPDLITMNNLASFGPLERPPVQFPHDLHTAALAGQDQDCNACHPAREDGRPARLFMRLEDMARAELEELYHTECLDCHSKNRAEGKASGPVTCGQCHARDTAYISSREPFGFREEI